MKKIEALFQLRKLEEEIEKYRDCDVPEENTGKKEELRKYVLALDAATDIFCHNILAQILSGNFSVLDDATPEEISALYVACRDARHTDRRD